MQIQIKIRTRKKKLFFSSVMNSISPHYSSHCDTKEEEKINKIK